MTGSSEPDGADCPSLREATLKWDTKAFFKIRKSASRPGLHGDALFNLAQWGILSNHVSTAVA